MSSILLRVTIGLAIALAMSVAGNYALWQKARAAEAAVQPLRDAAIAAAKIAEGHRTARERCEAEKLAMRTANDKAVAEAEAARRQAEADLEEFMRRFTNPPPECRAVLEMRVCAALLDY